MVCIWMLLSMCHTGVMLAQAISDLGRKTGAVLAPFNLVKILHVDKALSSCSPGLTYNLTCNSGISSEGSGI